METDNAIEIDEIKPAESGRPHPAWIGAAAVVVIALLALLPTAGSSPPSEAVPTMLPPPATAAERSEISAPIAIAAGFVDAYGTFDVDLAASFLAADADLSRLEGGQSKWRLGNEWLQVVDFQLELASCATLESSAPGVWVRCWYEFHALGSEKIGHTPFDAWFDVSIADGRIVAAWQTWPTGAFVEKVWDPFAGWVAQTHPDDIEIMYTNIARVWQRTSEESIALWEKRVVEYTGSPKAQYLSEVRSICETATERFEQAGGRWDLKMDTASYQLAHRISAEALAELRTLPPPSESERLAEIFSLMGQQTDVLGQIAVAASAGDRVLVESLSRRRVDLTHEKDNRGGPRLLEPPNQPACLAARRATRRLVDQSGRSLRNGR